MSAQHTPGPWHWDADAIKNDPLGRVRYRVTTVGKTIAQVYYSSFEGGLTNAEWDARLIASAPDLLDALREQIAAFDSDSFEEIEAEYGLGTAQRIFSARAAIAKATGSAQ